MATESYLAYITHSVYGTFARDMFVVMAVVLGLGGLLRERELGTVWTTLSLPVRRHDVAWSRAAVGILEVVLLALIPGTTAVTVGFLLREPLSLTWVAVATGWALAGAFVFALSFMVSTLAGGDYASPALAFASVIICAALLDRVPDRAAFNPFLLIGSTGRLPPGLVAATLLLVIGLIGLGVRSTTAWDAS